MFIALFLLYLFLGFYFIQNKSLLPFILVTVILPITSSLMMLHTHFQVNVYYVFIFVIVLYAFIKILLKAKIPKELLLVLILIFGFIFFYIIYDLFLYPDNIEVIPLLKDIKPLVFLFFGFIFIYLLEGQKIDWNGSIAKRIMKYNFIASLFWFVILNETPLISWVSDDLYYHIRETRYSAIGLSFVALYFLAGLASSRKFDKYDLVYILVPLFLSGNRTILLSAVIIYILNVIISYRNFIDLIKKALVLLVAFLVMIFGVFNFNENIKVRLLTMMHYDTIVNELINNRFSPFFEKLITYKWFDYILGKGIGETIFIPWFQYRENIDNYNIYMDNIYLTMYIKYGFLSLIIFWLFYFFIKKATSNRRFQIFVLCYYLIFGLTTAFMYQTKFLFILLILVTFKVYQKSET